MPGTLHEDTDPSGTQPEPQIDSQNIGHIGPINRQVLETEWKPYVKTVEESIVPGLNNDDFWMLVRRFNKVLTPSPKSLPLRTHLLANYANHPWS